MAKSKKRKKVTRRKGTGSGRSSGGGKEKRSRSGAMMGMRAGFKGIAGSVVGKEAKSSRTQKVVNIFWWVVTIVLGAVAIVLVYNRFIR